MQNRSALFPIHLWNMIERLAKVIIAWTIQLKHFFNVWNSHLSPTTTFTKFMKRVVKETQSWRTIVEDYYILGLDTDTVPKPTKYRRFDTESYRKYRTENIRNRIIPKIPYRKYENRNLIPKVNTGLRYPTLLYIHNPSDGIRGGLVRRKKMDSPRSKKFSAIFRWFLHTEPA